MKAEILDTRKDDRGTCYLCRASLDDYVAGLPSTYQDYEVQREIVTNVYLDRLIDTVLHRRHIPPIVLVVDETDFSFTGKTLKLTTFKILDGLQRSFRLKAIHDTFAFFNRTVAGRGDVLEWTKFKLSRSFGAELRAFNSNTDMLMSTIEFSRGSKGSDPMRSFQGNFQWFEIWAGLTPDEQVRKMLVLNAGHKPVKTRHQLELLFLNILPSLRDKDTAAFVLVRERDVSATTFSKGRQTGEFHFAHVIAALLSLYEGKPVTTTTALIEDIQDEASGIERYSKFTNRRFLHSFVAFLLRLDQILKEQHGELGTLWIGREVSLAGLCGAIGKAGSRNAAECEQQMATFTTFLENHKGILNLGGYEEARNSVDLSKVNIGEVNRRAIFNAMTDLIGDRRPQPINWAEYFGGKER